MSGCRINLPRDLAPGLVRVMKARACFLLIGGNFGGCVRSLVKGEQGFFFFFLSLSVSERVIPLKAVWPAV